MVERLKPMNPTQFGRQLKSLGHEKRKSHGNIYWIDLDYYKKYEEAADDDMPF